MKIHIKIYDPQRGPILTPLSVANGSMGVQYLPWVINEHCLEFTQLSSRNIDVRVVPDLRMQEI